MKRFIYFVACWLAVAIIFVPKTLWAYPFMIRHEYPLCSSCHEDPSGAGLINTMGRIMGDDVLRTVYGSGNPNPGSKTEFPLGHVRYFTFGGSWRSGTFINKPEGLPVNGRYIIMQADLRAQFKYRRFRTNAAIGYVPSGGQLAALFPDSPLSIISREHWVGLDLGENEDFLLRAGRINLPYGIRNSEHSLWTRSETRTDINVSQQHGIALSYSANHWRGEAMLIAGNYQLRPDLYRERGYSGYLEYNFQDRHAIGISSLLTAAQGDIGRSIRRPITRSAHGVFVRSSPVHPLVLLGQADMLVTKREADRTRVGTVGYFQVDYEMTRGLHFAPTMEIRYRGEENEKLSYGSWLSTIWYFGPHFDGRIDAIYRSISTPVSRVSSSTIIAMIHAYL
jgi:hypothetical protein